MDTENPEMKPGFLGGKFAPQDAGLPAGGWQRLEVELRPKRRALPLWLFSLLGLLLGLGGYVEFRRLLQNRPLAKQESVRQAILSTKSSQEHVSISQPPAKPPTKSAASEKGGNPATERYKSQPKAIAPKTEPKQKPLLIQDDQPAISERPETGSLKTDTKQKPTIAGRARQAFSLPVLSRKMVEQTILAKAERAGGKRKPDSHNQPESSVANEAEKRSIADQLIMPNVPAISEIQPFNTATEESPTLSTNPSLLSTEAEPASLNAQDGQNSLSLASILANPALPTADSTAAKVANLPSKIDSLALAKKAEEPVATPVPSRFILESGLRALIRDREAALVGREDATQLSWDDQKRPIPGVELFGVFGYRLGKTVVVGTGLGLGGWQEHISLQEAARTATPQLNPVAGTGDYELSLPYAPSQTHNHTWLTAQAHTELWIRLAPLGSHFALQAGPSLDALTSFARRGEHLPTGTAVLPGMAGSIRYQAGKLFYEASVRHTWGTAFTAPGYYQVKYQYVTLGVGYVW